MHDRLVRCDNPEGETWFYRYDPFGRRLSKVRKLSDRELAWTAQKHAALVPAAAREATKIWTWPEPPNGAYITNDKPPVVGVNFMWDGDLITDEAPLRLDGAVDWAKANHWYYEPRTFRPLAKASAEYKLLLLVNDHLGTPHEMFDDFGNLAWAISCTAWGVVRRAKATLTNDDDVGQAIYPRASGTARPLALEPMDNTHACPIRFPGQWADTESGLNYNRYRFYDPLAAQYISSDPIRLLGGQRLHSYVSNPGVWTDPLGLKSGVGNYSADPTEQGLSDIKQHLSRKELDHSPANDAMIERIAVAMSKGKKLHGADANFYLHELAEKKLMDGGMGYDAAHAAALGQYGVSPYSLYSPDVVQRFPDMFNSNWQNFWAGK